MMRWLLRVLVVCVAAVMLVCGVAGFYFLVYSADLPDFYALKRYAPSQAQRVSDPCLPGDSIALSSRKMNY